MEQFSKEEVLFWTQRLVKHGHTGWSDPLIYVFDQLERLQLLRAVLASNPTEGKIALDFGCGTGDFCQLLLDLGFIVYGYDPFVSANIQSSKFIHVNDLSATPFAPRSIDLVLTVTVLDHILDEHALSLQLSLIRNLLKDEGKLVVVEYALDDDIDDWRRKHSNGHQALRSMNEWRDILQKHSLEITTVRPFPSPLFAPSRQYKLYTKNVLVRLLRQLSRYHSRSLTRDRILRCVSKAILRNSVYVEPPKSPLKLIECCPISGGE
jgi:SAM-dependent methyltransferase